MPPARRGRSVRAGGAAAQTAQQRTPPGSPAIAARPPRTPADRAPPSRAPSGPGDRQAAERLRAQSRVAARPPPARRPSPGAARWRWRRRLCGAARQDLSVDVEVPEVRRPSRRQRAAPPSTRNDSSATGGYPSPRPAPEHRHQRIDGRHRVRRARLRPPAPGLISSSAASSHRFPFDRAKRATGGLSNAAPLMRSASRKSPTGRRSTMPRQSDDRVPIADRTLTERQPPPPRRNAGQG
jgi:hypothetical protein